MILLVFNVKNVGSPLVGNYDKSAKPYLTTKSWMKGIYQASIEKYFSDHIPSRDFIIRFYNSFRFTFMNHVIAEGVTVGKSDVLYQQMYIDAFLGRDLVKSEEIEKNVQQLRMVQDSLKANNKLLVFIIAPGKASVYPEYLPDSVKWQQASQNNYSAYTLALQKAGCEVVDFRKWLLQIKPTLQYPVYPKNGTHWSGHLLPLLMDSLKKYIEFNSTFTLPSFTFIPGAETTKDLKYTDNDIGEKLNLLCEPDQWKLSYPIVSFSKPIAKKPNLLSIGDSYNQSFWGFYPFFQQLFGDSTQFWYYNNLIGWPDELQKKYIDVKSLDLFDEVMSRDIVFIVSTEQNLKTFSFNFVNEFYPYVKYGIKRYELDRSLMIRKIKGSPEWSYKMNEKSVSNGIPLERMIRMDVEWLLFNQ
ncbi:MAG: hypothetical protein IPK10_06975 [Bacteroidetes bacterium]|nr:hypothetical protein [Bacteroidota bacterium]